MITTKQKQVLDYITSYYEKNGYIPTQQDIATGIKLKSTSTVHQHIKELVRKGFLTQSGEYGALELANNSKETVEVPIIGSIAAGQPIEAIEDETATVTMRKPLANDEFYALQVVGDSMIDDGIFSGDVVIIKKQQSAENGQTVVAIIDDNLATLKKIYKLKDRIRLEPANQTLLPIFRKEVEVRGIVWEVRRGFNTERLSKTNKKTKILRTLDLFAGIGGIRAGFDKSDFKTVFANDFEDACKVTYDLNFKTSKLLIEDITKINTKDLPEFDILLAGFPCQAFSIAGYRHGFNDTKGRGNLFFDIARIIDDKNPEGFLLENVKNLMTHDSGNTYKTIKTILESKLKYKVKEKVMNSMEYGNVPQNRERIYIVGFKDHHKTEAFEFPEKVPLTTKITDLLEHNVENKYYYNGKPLFEKLKDTVNEKGQVYQWRRQYVRKNKRGVCPTLTANMGMGGHNVPIIYDGKGIRKLTPRECARIQGFPDTYILPSTLPDSKLYKQIGNSVTVPVLERIARQIEVVLS